MSYITHMKFVHLCHKLQTQKKTYNGKGIMRQKKYDVCKMERYSNDLAS